jgi:hypothetical protein
MNELKLENLQLRRFNIELQAKLMALDHERISAEIAAIEKQIEEEKSGQDKVESSDAD